MAPLRRYLRITKHSVLEVRIYLDRPADAEAWLLKRDNPALPRVIKAIRPLVLPKLREENERGKGRAGAKAKKKGVKDVVVEDDFEVSIFLTELSSRHSVMTKQKMFKDKPRIQSNSGKLTNWLTTGTSDDPVVLNEIATDPIVIDEEDNEAAVNLADIPEAPERPTRKKRGLTEIENDDDSNARGVEGDLFVPETTSKRGKTGVTLPDAEVIENKNESQDDKKKMGLDTSYEGFSIYGRILCLVVKRRGVKNATGGLPVSSQQMLESWVSTQAAGQTGEDDEDNG